MLVVTVEVRVNTHPSNAQEMLKQLRDRAFEQTVKQAVVVAENYADNELNLDAVMSVSVEVDIDKDDKPNHSYIRFFNRELTTSGG